MFGSVDIRLINQLVHLPGRFKGEFERYNITHKQKYVYKDARNAHKWPHTEHYNSSFSIYTVITCEFDNIN